MNKEFISLLYIYNSDTREDLSKFSKQNGFILQSCDDVLKAPAVINQSRPDLILIESDCFQHSRFKKNIHDCLKHSGDLMSVVFLILPEMPEPEKRVDLMRRGVDDFLIHPFLTEEVNEKFRVYSRLSHLQQDNFLKNTKLEKTFTYLDKFKDELKKIKTELFEERTTLNNALKQVNQMTLERKRLKKDRRDIKTNFLNNMEGFGTLLYRLIRTRVEKNRGHGERVAHIAGFIAKQFNFNEKKLEDLRKAAMLHEVGLLFIPEEILKKTKDELTEYETDLFVQYPVKGADLLSNCTEFCNSAEIIRSLNENSDGTGRPLGLKRKYISLLSRILAGADMFDTLKDEQEISSLDVLLEKLETFSGTRLDPSIVAWLEKYAVLHMKSDSHRVKGVGIHQLKPGMTLGTALFTNAGTKLFSVNTLLTPDAIDKIKKYNREYPVDETVYIRA